MNLKSVHSLIHYQNAPAISTSMGVSNLELPKSIQGDGSFSTNCIQINIALLKQKGYSKEEALTS